MNRPEPTMHFKLDLSARLIFFQWKLIVVDKAQGVNIVYRYEFSDMPEGFIVQDFKILALGQYLPDVLHIGTGRFSWDPVCFGTVADAKAAKTLRRRRRRDAVQTLI